MTPAGIILAGGHSRRMGTDKALLRVPGAYQGQPLICGISQLLATRCDSQLILSRPDQLLPPLQATILHDTHPGHGPLVALGAGLEYAHHHGLTHAFVCAVDMPCLSEEFLDWLFTQPDAPVIIPTTSTHQHYLVGIYHTDLAAAMIEATQAGQRSLGRFITSISAQFVPVPPRLTPALTNLNYPIDLGSFFT